MANETLPSNLDDPRFGEMNARTNVDWDGPNAVPWWLWEVIEGVLDALPQVLERALHR